MLRLDPHEVRRTLAQALDNDATLVCVHANVAAMGQLAGAQGSDQAQALLELLLEALGPSRTVLMPTFTLSFFRTGRFHYAATPSETGALSERLRLLPGALRTPCPLNSFAAYGPRARELADTVGGETCWGPGSVFDLMARENALVVGLGASLAASASIFHHAEELAGVPYRYFKTVRGLADFGQGEREVAKRFYVGRRDLPTAYTYHAPLAALEQKGGLGLTRLGMSRVETIRAGEAVETYLKLLRDNPIASLKDQKGYRLQRERKCFAFFASSNLDLFAADFGDEYLAVTGEPCRQIGLPFGQYRQHALDPDSDLRAADPDYLVFAERAEDLFADVLMREDQGQAGEGGLDQRVGRRLVGYLDFLRQARKLFSGRFLVCNFEPLEPSVLQNAEATAPDGARAAVRLANAMLAEVVESLPDCHLVDYAGATRRMGTERAFGGKYWHMGRIPFSRAFNQALARRIVGVTLALEGRTTRLIVLDLDNTLWGGVVGDDGVGGIRLGGDYPGNVFKQWQRYLKALCARGIALAVCSKNTHEVAMQAIETHEHMVLRKDDFAAFRINWEDKGSNLVSLCEEVNLGPQSVMFLDDNSLERQWVRSRLPDCIVPDLPADPGRWIAFLAESPFLETVRLTDEDRKRGRQYVLRRQMADKRDSAASVEDFLASLGMVVTVEAYDASRNAARVLQLFAKTNQFNTTTRRYSQTDLQALVAKGGRVLAVSLEDAAFEREIIAAAALAPAGDTLEIDCLVMSCRAMGRKVETAVLDAVARLAARMGFSRVRGRILPTPKNLPVRALYESHGFAREDDTTFALDLSNGQGPRSPSFITLKLHGENHG